MSEQIRNIEQLWYVWTPAGAVWQNNVAYSFAELGVLGASPTLTIPDTQQFIQSIDHSWPNETNFMHGSSEPPISLALRQMESGRRFLMHKIYLRNTTGQPIAVVCHVLFDLPQNFTLQDVIGLWKAQLWRTESTSSTGHIELPLLSPAELRGMASFKRGDDKEAWTYLSYLMYLYLLQQHAIETKNPYSPIHITASSERVAHLILGLSHLIPQSLLSSVTFSTYEPLAQLKPSGCRIVGQGLLPMQFKPTQPAVWQLDTSQPQQPLDQKLLNLSPEIWSYTQYAIEASNRQKLEPFIADFHRLSQQTVNTLLALSEKRFKPVKPSVPAIQESAPPATASSDPTSALPRPSSKRESPSRAKSLPKEDIIAIFKDPSHLLKHLQNASTCRQIVNFMVTDPWFTQERPTYILRLKEEKEADTQQAFDLLVYEVIARLLEEARAAHVDRFQPIFNVLWQLVPPNNNEPLWIEFFQQLQKDQGALSFTQRFWSVRQVLLEAARLVLSPDEVNDDALVAPLLTASIRDVPKFLPLQLPPRWNYLVMKHVTPERSAVAREGLITDGTPITELVESVLHVRESDKWQVLLAFFKDLVALHYRHKQQLLFQLLEACSEDAIADDLLTSAQLTDNEALAFFTRYSEDDFHLCYSVPRARSHYMQLVSSHPELKPFLKRCLQMPGDLPLPELDQLITISGLTNYEQAELFEEGGKRYLQLYPQSPALLRLANCYLWHLCQEKQITRKFLLKLSQIIKDLPAKSRASLYKIFAEYLLVCIGDAVDLSLFVATFSMTLGPETTNQFIIAMADHIRNDMIQQVISETASSQEEPERIVSRFTAFLQFALCADTMHDLPTSPKQKLSSTELLSRLLGNGQNMKQQETSQQEQLLNFINTSMVKSWPADLRNRWQEEGQYNRQPGEGDWGNQDLQQRDNFDLTAQLNAVLKELKEDERASYEEEWKDIAKQMSDVIMKNNLKDLALFFMQNRVALTLHHEMVGPPRWATLILAYELYLLMKNSRGQHLSQDTAQTIINLFNQNKHLKPPITFNNKELQFIRAAEKRSKA